MEFYQSNDHIYKPFYCIDMEKTGKNIKRLVREKGMTVHELSVRLGDVSEQAIYKWFRGDNLPSIDNLHRLKQILELETMDELIVSTESLTTI